MYLFFSGSPDISWSPERILAHTNKGKGPCVLITSDEIRRNVKRTVDRFKRHKKDVANGMTDKDKIHKFFLDSGAFSIYNREVRKKGLARLKKHQRYGYYETDDFWKSVDEYGSFVKKNIKCIDLYANLDVILNPELSWKVQRHLESKFGINPIPVLHWGTSMEWIKHYFREGYDLIGLGGTPKEISRKAYAIWADRIFKMAPKGVRIHGFAQTSFVVMQRYPWWSVDSATWLKTGAFGRIHVPHQRNGKFVFDEHPYIVNVSVESPYTILGDLHIRTCSKEVRKQILNWLEYIEMPLGKTARDKEGNLIRGKRNIPVRIEDGVENDANKRAAANAIFFKKLEESIPKWPWPFTANQQDGFGIHLMK